MDKDFAQIPRYKTANVEDLIPYARNSRTHSDAQVGKIAASIREFGFLNPVIIDGQNGIIAGHGRVMAAQKLGLETVPVIEASHLTEAQRRAYVIADNRLALDAGWDEEMLRVEFAELADMGFDLELTGFGLDEIAGLQIDEIEEGLADEDAVPEAPEKPVSVLGDIWQLGNHRLMCGDSTSVDNVDKLMDGKKADMIFTDPPYGVDYEGIHNDSRSGLKDLLDAVFSNYLLFSKEGSSFYCFHSDKCADIFHEVFRKYCHFSSMIIWVKPALVLSQSDYHSRHEPCMYGWLNNGTHKWYSDRKQTTVWEYEKETFKGHTTPKPVEMVSYAISNSSPSNSNVIDLFGGSGSTLIACQKTGRTAYLMELDPKYCDVIINRWQDFTGKQAVHEETKKTFEELANGG